MGLYKEKKTSQNMSTRLKNCKTTILAFFTIQQIHSVTSCSKSSINFQKLRKYFYCLISSCDQSE